MKIKQKILLRIQSLLFILNSFLLNTISVNAMIISGPIMKKFNNFTKTYQPAINIGLGFLLICSMITFIFHIVKLTQTADNPPKRAEAIHNLLICGVCLAIQGSFSLFIVLYFTLFS